MTRVWRTRMVWRTVPSICAGVLACMSGCDPDSPCPSADLGAPIAEPSFAVVASDRFSTAIALLDADGALLDEAWIDSGTVRPGIAAALSGDVVLPSTPIAGELTLLDRFGVDVVTRIGLEDGVVRAQLPTQLGRDESRGGFRANPQDVITLADGSLWASRHEPNPDPAAPPLDRGNDLAIIDPAARAVVDRVDLSVLDVDVIADADGDGDDETVHVFARPSRLAHVGRFVVVGLVRLDESFGVLGPGAVGIVDVETRAVSSVALDGLANCGELRAIPGSPDQVVIVCRGATFTDAEGRRPTAGLAIVRVSDASAIVEHVFFAAARVDLPVVSGAPIPLGGTRVAYPAERAAPGADALVSLDLATGAAEVVFDADGASVLGTGVLDSARALVLIPEARVGIRRLDLAEDVLTARDTVVVSTCRGLPAIEIAAVHP